MVKKSDKQGIKALSSGSSYYHRLKVRRAQRILDGHYRNLLSGGKLLLVKDVSNAPFPEENPED